MTALRMTKSQEAARLLVSGGLLMKDLLHYRTHPVPDQRAHGVMQKVAQLEAAPAGDELRDLDTE